MFSWLFRSLSSDNTFDNTSNSKLEGTSSDWAWGSSGKKREPKKKVKYRGKPKDSKESDDCSCAEHESDLESSSESESDEKSVARSRKRSGTKQRVCDVKACQHYWGNSLIIESETINAAW